MKQLLALLLSATLLQAAAATPVTPVATEATVPGGFADGEAPQEKEQPHEATTKPKGSKWKNLLKPLKWIGKNWSAYDPEYSIPSFYDWAVQLQNTTSMEWLKLENTDGMNLRMRSRMSNRIGPYAGYRFLFYGYTVDLNSLGHPSKRRNEFTLSINSNLLNLDIIRRRTGGDFQVSELTLADGHGGRVDFMPFAEMVDLDDYIDNDVTGFNLNIFTNHKKYSNPAAFSNGAIQLRSAGSPIVGLGYSHQKAHTDIADLFFAVGSVFTLDDNGEMLLTEEQLNRLADLYDNDSEAFRKEMFGFLNKAWPYMARKDGETYTLNRAMLTTPVPTTTRIDDWHLQLGYAYNLVFSRRVLLGLSFTAAPGVMRMRADNKASTTYQMADEFSQLIKQHEHIDVDPDHFRYHENETSFNLNASGRASLTFNYNRWRAGFNARFNGYYSANRAFNVKNTFGSLTLYLGYCFGRKKEFRHGGANRQQYILAALTPSQIEEMRDTAPASNLAPATKATVPIGFADGKATATRANRLHNDMFDLDIIGCDLVKGPEGRYGWFELTDGFVPPDKDTTNAIPIAKGTVVEIDDKGSFTLEAPHRNSIRAGNWWKSKLSLNQMPNHWYPEMLHYALKGKLTLYLRGRIFGTRNPIRLDIDDVYLNHGKDAKTFKQIGVQHFHSKSTYSIEGRAKVNDRNMRVYIEQRQSGKHTYMYISRVHENNSSWMGQIEGHRPLSKISMPGTHDSGSASLAESPIFSAGHTQNFSVPDQLNDGIRAFDLRLKRTLHYGHTMTCRESFDSTMVAWDNFLRQNPTECIVAMVGSDEGGKWEQELTSNFKRIIKKYPHRFVEHFSGATPLDSVRGKILVIKRQEACPFGKLLKFEDNATFTSNGFQVEDVYKEHKSWKKLKLVEQNIREAYENDKPGKWYITFCSVAWAPQRHTAYSYAWGEAKHIRHPINKNLRDILELKDYTNFGIVFLDFYNNHGESPQLVETIIKSNFNPYD